MTQLRCAPCRRPVERIGAHGVERIAGALRLGASAVDALPALKGIVGVHERGHHGRSALARLGPDAHRALRLVPLRQLAFAGASVDFISHSMSKNVRTGAANARFRWLLEHCGGGRCLGWNNGRPGRCLKPAYYYLTHELSAQRRWA
jgi:hypothetical protein